MPQPQTNRSNKPPRRQYCSVYGCMNSSASHPGISFFGIPRDERGKEWLRLIDREELLENGQRCKICEAHFRPEDFTVTSRCKNLRKPSVPSLNLPVRTKQARETQAQPSTSDVMMQTEPVFWTLPFTLHRGSERQMDNGLEVLSSRTHTLDIQRRQRKRKASTSELCLEAKPAIDPLSLQPDQGDSSSQTRSELPPGAAPKPAIIVASTSESDTVIATELYHLIERLIRLPRSTQIDICPYINKLVEINESVLNGSNGARVVNARLESTLRQLMITNDNTISQDVDMSEQSAMNLGDSDDKVDYKETITKLEFEETTVDTLEVTDPLDDTRSITKSEIEETPADTKEVNNQLDDTRSIAKSETEEIPVETSLKVIHQSPDTRSIVKLEFEETPVDTSLEANDLLDDTRSIAKSEIEETPVDTISEVIHQSPDTRSIEEFKYEDTPIDSSLAVNHPSGVTTLTVNDPSDVTSSTVNHPPDATSLEVDHPSDATSLEVDHPSDITSLEVNHPSEATSLEVVHPSDATSLEVDLPSDGPSLAVNHSSVSPPTIALDLNMTD